MNEHVSAWLEAYHDGELDGRRLHQVISHLAQCAACRAELDRLQALSTLLQASPAASHLTPPERFVAQVGLRLPRYQAHPLWYQAASIGWRLTPVGLFGAYAILQAVFIVTGIVMLALPLGGEPARQSVAWFNSLGTGLNNLAPIGLTVLDSVFSINWGVMLYLGLTAVIGLLYWSWLATWWVRQHHRPQAGWEENTRWTPNLSE
jgi:anti-sigma factor RsiW